jgi:hypothetical protein
MKVGFLQRKSRMDHKKILEQPSYSLTGSLYVAQAGLKLVILLLPLCECWSYRHEPSCPVNILIL